MIAARLAIARKAIHMSPVKTKMARRTQTPATTTPVWRPSTTWQEAAHNGQEEAARLPAIPLPLMQVMVSPSPFALPPDRIACPDASCPLSACRDR